MFENTGNDRKFLSNIVKIADNLGRIADALEGVPKDQKKYVDSDGQRCPNCGSGDIAKPWKTSPFDDDSRVECKNCQATWLPTYKLTGFAELEVND
jgi:hypothetical protein